MLFEIKHICRLNSFKYKANHFGVILGNFKWKNCDFYIETPNKVYSVKLCGMYFKMNLCDFRDAEHYAIRTLAFQLPHTKNSIEYKVKTKPAYNFRYRFAETYYTKDNIEISVGKNNLQNDYLTFKHAHRYDTWFHVKDMPGSHVVVKGDQLDEYTIRLASNIAACYSKGKNSSSVPVNYTLIKTLKKPHGAKPGQVILDSYKTIYIDPDISCLNELKKK